MVLNFIVPLIALILINFSKKKIKNNYKKKYFNFVNLSSLKGRFLLADKFTTRKI